MPTTSDTCSTCRFWVPNDEPQGITSDHGWGECRLLPPRVVVVGGQAKTLFPVTTGELGCGEHKRVDRTPLSTGYPSPS